MSKKLSALLLALFPPALYEAVRTVVFHCAALAVRWSVSPGDTFAENRARLALRAARPWLMLGGAALTLLIVLLLFRRTLFAGGYRPRPGGVLILTEIGVGLNLALNGLILLLPLPASWFAEHSGAVDDPLGAAGPVVKLLCTVIAAPVAEEILFRGLTQRFLARAFSPCFAVLWQALLFAAFHGTKLQLLYVFPAGIVLGLIYHRSGSLLAPILTHMAFNAFSELSIPLPGSVWGLLFCLLGGIGIALLGLMSFFTTARSAGSNRFPPSPRPQ
ncbi:MAG: CPBP family intramembrane metalloprotease [Oscillospiraceae bacterium]|jgi:membrane protease YdiL (CAAX protease family)|nr:CPBP family intramembrane metalloprotease [Oscillospiraceae bacterium]